MNMLNCSDVLLDHIDFLYGYFFFTNSRESDPKILRINNGKSQSYVIPENALI